MAWYWWILIVSGALLLLLALSIEWVRNLLWLLGNVLGLIFDLFG